MTSLPRNKVECKPFIEKDFIDIVQQYSGQHKNTPPSQQIIYLSKYLLELKVKTLVIEHHYIDRNFIEEVASYYSRCFFNHQNHSIRVHFFSDIININDVTLNNLLISAAEGSHKEVNETLQNAYIGFVVVRPIPSVPIGRTILPPITGASRRFPAIVDNTVHLLGFTFRVKGLAFQQQDRAVAACATTAIWIALQRMCWAESYRGPTTSEIGDAASRYHIPDGRAIPSPGLRLEQICDAIRQFGFAPIVLHAVPPIEFLLSLNVYLRSGIPVFLAVGKHAVTIIGYEEPTTLHEISDDKRVLRILNQECRRVYVHDDRIGPYVTADFKLLPPSKVSIFLERENSTFEKAAIIKDKITDTLFIEICLPNKKSELHPVRYAVFPVYPKMRATAVELFKKAALFQPLAKKRIAGDKTLLDINLHFERSHSYLYSLFEQPLLPHRLAAFQKSVALSRYVGIIRYSVAGKNLFDAIWDTTDTIRDIPREHLLGLVALDSQIAGNIDVVAHALGVPSA